MRIVRRLSVASNPMSGYADIEARKSDMMNTIKAIFKEGKIELLEHVDIPEGTEVLVTILSDEAEFWLRASESSLASVWDNEEDDIYEQLLKR
jgi:predicted DNA-binding antitoxin AbrB/MazE fold protein